jgi:endonuclease/exonuclease/phosphatase family metal-dependent hydrolase
MIFRFLLCVWFVPLYSAARDAVPAPPPPFRVLTWNLHHGEGIDGKLDLARQAAFIKEVDADAVFLQEVDRKTKRTGGVDQAAELGRLTGMEVTFGKAMDYDGGEYGNAILTRSKPAASKVIPLSGGKEPRAALEVQIKDTHGLSADRTLTLVGTHFDHEVAASREAAAQQLAARFGKQAGTVIFGGDLNCQPDDPPLKAFAAPWIVPKKQGAQTLTCPCPNPRSEIDFLLVKPSAAALNIPRCEVLDENVASDHRPVVLEVQRK